MARASKQTATRKPMRPVELETDEHRLVPVVGLLLCKLFENTDFNHDLEALWPAGAGASA